MPKALLEGGWNVGWPFKGGYRSASPCQMGNKREKRFWLTPRAHHPDSSNWNSFVLWLLTVLTTDVAREVFHWDMDSSSWLLHEWPAYAFNISMDNQFDYSCSFPVCPFKLNAKQFVTPFNRYKNLFLKGHLLSSSSSSFLILDESPVQLSPTCERLSLHYFLGRPTSLLPTRNLSPAVLTNLRLSIQLMCSFQSFFLFAAEDSGDD